MSAYKQRSRESVGEGLCTRPCAVAAAPSQSTVIVARQLEHASLRNRARLVGVRAHTCMCQYCLTHAHTYTDVCHCDAVQREEMNKGERESRRVRRWECETGDRDTARL